MSMLLGKGEKMYKVFIVDDEKLIAMGLEKIINWKQLGCSTAGFTSSIEAYKSALLEPPDIIIIDIKMPYMDGLQLVEKLRNAGIKAEVIVLIHFSEFEYAKKGAAFGVNTYLLKPLEEEEVISAVRQSIHQLQKQKEIQKGQEIINTVQIKIDPMKNKTGYTCTNYMNNKRIERAKKILLKPSVNLYEITCNVNYQYFK